MGGALMIAIGSDHGGYALKEEVKKYLDEKGIEYKDFGCYSEERTDYPIYGEAVAKAVQSKECEKGILICGTGFGMTMVANKFKGIRCASCWNEEVAKLLKAHNNANIIALPGRFINISQAVVMIRAWLATEFMEGRHTDRLQMIEDIENENMK
jgi:ribose 5-phosphate isomerase B